MKRVLSLAIVLMLAFSCVFTAFAQTDDTASPDEAKKVTELKITKLPDKLTYTAEDVIEPDIDLSKIADENATEESLIKYFSQFNLELKLDLGVAGVDLIDGQLGTVDHGLAVDGVVAGQGADGAQLKGLDLVAGLGGIRIAGIIGAAGTAGGQADSQGADNSDLGELFHSCIFLSENQNRYRAPTGRTGHRMLLYTF